MVSHWVLHQALSALRTRSPVEAPDPQDGTWVLIQEDPAAEEAVSLLSKARQCACAVLSSCAENASGRGHLYGGDGHVFAESVVAAVSYHLLRW
jgi:hypothetical protein